MSGNLDGWADLGVFILDRLTHHCHFNGGVECRACEVENLLAEDAPAECCRHFQGPDCEWCRMTTESDKDREVERLRRVEKYAREVMDALKRYGEGIVGHLLDTDDNCGEFLRRALTDKEPSDA